jgi:hypothetical protein
MLLLQVIDTAEQSLQNVITFPPDGSFIVNSSIQAGPPSPWGPCWVLAVK